MARFLLIATTNPGKVREVAVCLAGIPGLEVISLADLPPRPEVPETGSTFEENAAAKAVGYGRA
ncbi:MAG TPA: non-canonical purine NTP pyrophosphatase, partial [Candidatus Saccharimonadales bacterium]|nr:non-canonical purine NTP pyrophosphatase [Candidatus Saccharimonadales bacterium]